MQTITAGTRIRLVVLDVDFGSVSTRVTRRYDWTGLNPEHMCHADKCETCTEGAIRTARRRLEPGSGKATATLSATITLLRDGQSVAK